MYSKLRLPVQDREEYAAGPLMEAEEMVRDSRANPGDLICFPRGLYSHWAFYEGDGWVIHVPAEDKSVTSVTITREKLVEVANRVSGKTKVNVDNQLWEAQTLTYRDEKKNCIFDRSIEDQLRYAQSKIGTTWRYCFLTHNCEHFATECKYGDGFSSQSPESDPKGLYKSETVLFPALPLVTHVRVQRANIPPTAFEDERFRRDNKIVKGIALGVELVTAFVFQPWKSHIVLMSVVNELLPQKRTENR